MFLNIPYLKVPKIKMKQQMHASALNLSVCISRFSLDVPRVSI
jgi:hypothetical protein